MKDIFDAKISCPECGGLMLKAQEAREGFRLRFLKCKKCPETIYHPLDLREYKEFNKLRERNFQVKLRMVGNSFSVTIPKEIIEFEEEFAQMEKEMNNIMRLTLEEPGRLSLHFRKLLEKQNG
jgi:DNA-directed RNA polymerase subunit M/transcription elongation factor TFIIS